MSDEKPHNPGEPQCGAGHGGEHNPGEPQFEEEEFGATELDRDDTHGLADEAADRAEGDA